MSETLKKQQGNGVVGVEHTMSSTSHALILMLFGLVLLVLVL